MTDIIDYAAGSAEDARARLENMGEEKGLYAAVVEELETAVKLASTAFVATRSAAYLASFEIGDLGDTSDEKYRVNLLDALDNTCNKYTDVFDGNHNIKSNFRNALLCFAYGDQPISFVDRKGKEIHTTGHEAGKLAKHDLSTAAKTIREDLGIGRKAGGGRKPNQTTSAPETSTDSAPETSTDSVPTGSAASEKHPETEKPDANTPARTRESVSVALNSLFEVFNRDAAMNILNELLAEHSASVRNKNK